MPRFSYCCLLSLFLSLSFPPAMYVIISYLVCWFVCVARFVSSTTIDGMTMHCLLSLPHLRCITLIAFMSLGFFYHGACIYLLIGKNSTDTGCHYFDG